MIASTVLLMSAVCLTGTFASPNTTTTNACYSCVTPNFSKHLQRGVFGLSELPATVTQDCLNNTNSMIPVECSSPCYELYVKYQKGRGKRTDEPRYVHYDRQLDFLEVAVVRGCQSLLVHDSVATTESCETGPLSLENVVPRTEGMVQQRICATPKCNNQSEILSHCNKPKVGTCHQCFASGKNPDVNCKATENVCLGAYCSDLTLPSGDEYVNIKGCISVNPHKNGTGCYTDDLGRYCWYASSASISGFSSVLFIAVALGLVGRSFY